MQFIFQCEVVLLIGVINFQVYVCFLREVEYWSDQGIFLFISIIVVVIYISCLLFGYCVFYVSDDLGCVVVWVFNCLVIQVVFYGIVK